MAEPQTSILPPDVLEKLTELELELAEGDITQKGYEKKRSRLVAPYLQKARSEAVQEALSRHTPTDVAPSPFRRPSVKKPRNSNLENGNPPRRITSPSDTPPPIGRLPKADYTPPSSIASSTTSLHRTDSTDFPPPPSMEELETRLSHFHGVDFLPQPDVTGQANLLVLPVGNEHSRAGIGNRKSTMQNLPTVRLKSDSDDADVSGRVSAKILQLLNTLKRPKKKPLEQFYTDDSDYVEDLPPDPNAPKPEGQTIKAVVGEQLLPPQASPKTLVDALKHYGTMYTKSPALSIIDNHGKTSNTLVYGKLWSRANKVAYHLLNKVGSHKEGTSIMVGDRVALVYPTEDPLSFISAFYGCLLAGVIPVPVEVPRAKEEPGGQKMGFLLGSCLVSWALTTDSCLKTLPKDETGHVVTFRGWPKLQWFVTENLSRPLKEWEPPSGLDRTSPAYIESTVGIDGAVMGVTVTRASMLCHCQTLTQACLYIEGEIMVNVVNPKREVGLWHSTLSSVYNGMHVIYIPPAVVKNNPAVWLQMITKHRATCGVVSSRDLHWSLHASKEHKEINLTTLRLLLLADRANPWSLSACDAFLNTFESKGMKSEVLCPCAGSSETMTVALRRPGKPGSTATGRGVLSLSGLSYGVVRVDKEGSLTSLTLQDCGMVLPGAKVVVVKLDGSAELCKTDEIGELCVSSGCVGSAYWGLAGKTNQVFRIQPVDQDKRPIDRSVNTDYIRSGMLGFLGPGGLVFVCGTIDGLMKVSARRHNSDDIKATILAVDPIKFVYRGRIAIFSINVLRDERIVVVAEQRPNCSEEESFQWMSHVLPAVDSIHGVGIYCLCLVPPGGLPKMSTGHVHVHETKIKYLEGVLHPANVLMCPHTCVTNLPKPRPKFQEPGPASKLVGSLVMGTRVGGAQGREIAEIEEDSDVARKYQFLSEILRWRSQTTPEHVMFTLLNSKGNIAVALSCIQLHKRAERVAQMALEQGRLSSGDHVALIYPPGVELIVAVYGCLYAGLIPVPVRPPHSNNLSTTIPTVKMVVDVSKSRAVFTTTAIIKLLKMKESHSIVDSKSWPTLLSTEDAPKKKLQTPYRAPTPEMLAYIDFSVSPTGMLSGVKMSHAAVTALCRSMKLACELYPSRDIVICLDPYCGMGFVLWALTGVYSGHHTILVPPGDLETYPALWLSAVSQYKVRDTFCSYPVMDLCTKALGQAVPTLRSKGVNLSCVRTCVVVAEERPRINLAQAFSTLFAGLGLSARAVSTSFGCRVNIALCTQGASSPDTSSVYVDMRALRNDRVTLVERGAPHSICLMESGKILPGVKIAIANPETKGMCGDSHLGEIWVTSPHNCSGYYTLSSNDKTFEEQFQARMTTGDLETVWARTGYLGFLKRTDLTQTDGARHDALFVVGSSDEAMMLRGMRYHPVDIENAVIRCHKNICECAVFTWTNLLVVVTEYDGDENEALDVVPLVTSAVLEDHQLVVGVVVVVDPGVVPINSRGEKQRMHLRDGFLADQLDPIYVAYNM